MIPAKQSTNMKRAYSNIRNRMTLYLTCTKLLLYRISNSLYNSPVLSCPYRTMTEKEAQLWQRDRARLVSLCRNRGPHIT